MSEKIFRTTQFIKRYQFPVDNHYMIFNLTNSKPNIINELHSIQVRYDGIVLEGLLIYELLDNIKFNIHDYETLIKCVNFIISLKVNDFENKHRDIPEFELIKNIYELKCKDIINKINLIYSQAQSLQAHSQGSSFQAHSLKDIYEAHSLKDIYEADVVIYLVCYLLNHLEKNDELLNYDEFCNYFEELFDNIDIIHEYIINISKCLLDYFDNYSKDDIESSIKIETSKDNIQITGEADLRISNWLFDIKCSKELLNNIDSWHRQLEVYNEYIKSSNIAIINILTNHIIIFKTLDDFKKYKIENDFDETNQYNDLII